MNLRLSTPILAAALLSCSEEPQPVDPCKGNARTYASLAEGGELCDTQHLVAPLNANATDVKAGLGALHVPFRIQQREPRSYCFEDDNREKHRLTLASENGAIVAQLTAGDACQVLTLPAGAYTLRLEHENPGAIDDTPDMVHSQLRKGVSETTQFFSVNACEGCLLTDAEWPCRDNSAGGVSCGYVGDYAKTDFGASSCPSRWFDPEEIHGRGKVVSNCILSGAFDHARFSQVHFEPGQVLLGFFPYSNALRKTSSFLDTTWPERANTEVAISQVTELTGSPSNLFSSSVSLSADAPHVDLAFAEAFWGAQKFANYTRGPGARVDVTGLKVWSGRTLDFSRARFANAPVAGVVSYDDYRFENSTLLNLTFADGDARITMDRARFDGSKISDASIEAQSLVGATFTGATISNTRFGPRTGRDDVALWAGTNVTFQNATLKSVSLSERTDDPSKQTKGPDLTGVDMRGASILGLSAHHASLVNSNWDGATIGESDEASPLAFAASGADFAGASFKNLVRFSNVRWPGANVGPYVGAPARPFVITLSSPAAKMVFWNLDEATLDADLSDLTLRNPRLVAAKVAGTFQGTTFEAGSLDQALIGRAIFSRTRFLGTSFEGATIGGEFNNVEAPSASFNNAYFVNAKVNVFTGKGTKFVGTRFCSTTIASLHLSDFASLESAHVPLKNQLATQSLLEQPCAGVDTLRSVTTEPSVTCPDSFPGPCLTDSQWVPKVFNKAEPRCCEPGVDAGCRRKTTGGPCANKCDCESLVCTASGTCT